MNIKTILLWNKQILNFTLSELSYNFNLFGPKIKKIKLF